MYCDEGAFFIDLCTAMAAESIRYCVLRKAEEIITGDFHDIDMAVDERDLQKFHLLFDEKCRQNGWALHQIVDRDGLQAVHVFRSGAGGISILHLDLFRTFSWKGYALIQNSTLLQNRAMEGGVAVASEPIQAVTQLLSRLLYHGYIKEEYRENIHAVFGRQTTPCEAILRDVFDEKTARELTREIARRHWADIESDVFRLRRTVVRKHTPFDRAIYASRRGLRLVKRYLQKPSGVFVAFLGVDGSGKSTVIESLPDVLDRTFNRSQVDCYHWRPEFLKIVKGQGHTVVDPHKDLPRGKVGSLLKFLLFNLDFVFGYWCKIRFRLARGRMVAFDRYYYDYWIDKLRYRLDLDDRFIGVCSAFVPKPDCVILLTGDADLLYARKEELPPEEIRRQILRMQEARKFIPNSHFVNVNNPISLVLNDSCRIILETMSKRAARKERGYRTHVSA